MFVQSANFVARHQKSKRPIMEEVGIYGQEKGANNMRVAKMNLAIHGLSGKIELANSFYEDPHKSIGQFDYVLANPPFNVKGRDKNGQMVIDPSRLQGDKRFNYGLPLTSKGEISNANYLWIQMFLSALNNEGRAGFVMSNGASDASGVEKEIREKIIKSGYVDVIIQVGPKMFMNAAVSCTLWFFDKRKKETERKNKILFINAQDIFTSIDRARSEWTNLQIEEIVSIVRSYREENGSKKYQDIQGRCKTANIQEIEKNNYSLNPGQYITLKKINPTKSSFYSELEAYNSFLKNEVIISCKSSKKISDNFKKYYKELDWDNIEFYSYEILEQLIQLIYKQWFVDYKFPGCENVSFIESNTEYGKIPKDWEVVKIGDKFTTILGGTPSRAVSEYWENGTIAWINSGAINNLRITEPSELITEKALEKSAAKMMPIRTTLLAITGATLGQVSLSEIECSANQSVVGIYDKEGILNEYLYLRINDEIKNIIALAGGGAQQHINKDIINNKEILIPNKELAENFFKFIKPLFDEMSRIMLSKNNLHKLKDVMLFKNFTKE